MKNKVKKPPSIYGLKDSVQLCAGGTGHFAPFTNCCSATVIYGVSGYPTASVGTLTCRESTARNNVRMPKKCHTYQEYSDYYGRTGFYALPPHMRYLPLVETLYIKCVTRARVMKLYQAAVTQRGGMATKTVFCADKDKEKSSAKQQCSSYDFMAWCRDSNAIGEATVSPFAAGAHGGQCKGMVLAFDQKKARSYILKCLKELDTHAKLMKKHYGVTFKQHIKDATAKLW